MRKYKVVLFVNTKYTNVHTKYILCVNKQHSFVLFLSPSPRIGRTKSVLTKCTPREIPHHHQPLSEDAMRRPKHPDLGVVKPFGNKDTNLHIRIDAQLDGLLRAAATHAGLGVSNYVRWILQQATKQTLEGPSKADQLREASERMARMMAPLEPIPEHAIVKPRDPSVPLPVVEHAPTNFKPKADLNAMLSPVVAKVVTALEQSRPLNEERTLGQPAIPPPGVPASLPPLPAHRAPEPGPLTFKPPQGPSAKPQKLSMELSLEEFEAFYVRPNEPGPKPLELPDDMSDWT